jgi:hypothetical protein
MIGQPIQTGTIQEAEQSLFRLLDRHVIAMEEGAVLVMGEGNERTPLGLVTGLSWVTFQNRDPSEAELEALRIRPEDEFYAPLLQAGNWRRGANAKQREASGRESHGS